MGTTHDHIYDVASIGGGSSRLGAAPMLARARRAALSSTVGHQGKLGRRPRTVFPDRRA
ncbi:MAG: hypothetical protein WBA87_02465 [Microbacterium sp.]